MSDSLLSLVVRCCLATLQNSYCAHAYEKGQKSRTLKPQDFQIRNSSASSHSVVFDCHSFCINRCICRIIIKFCFCSSFASYIISGFLPFWLLHVSLQLCQLSMSFFLHWKVGMVGLRAVGSFVLTKWAMAGRFQSLCLATQAWTRDGSGLNVGFVTTLLLDPGQLLYSPGLLSV